MTATQSTLHLPHTSSCRWWPNSPLQEGGFTLLLLLIESFGCLNPSTTPWRELLHWMNVVLYSMYCTFFCTHQQKSHLNIVLYKKNLDSFEYSYCVFCAVNDMAVHDRAPYLLYQGSPEGLSAHLSLCQCTARAAIRIQFNLIVCVKIWDIPKLIPCDFSRGINSQIKFGLSRLSLWFSAMSLNFF